MKEGFLTGSGGVQEVFKRCSGVQAFRCSGVLCLEHRVWVHDIWEGLKGDRGRGPKMAKIHCGVKPGIFKRAALNGQNFGWSKKSNILGLLFGQKSDSNS